MRYYSKLAFLILVAGLWSCGKLPESTIVQPSTAQLIGGIPQSQVCFQGLAPCVMAAQFGATCLSVHGAITSKSGPAVCRVTRSYEYWENPELTLSYPGSLPILTPSTPQGGIETSIRLRKGSKLTYLALSPGKWGYLKVSQGSFLGGVFTWFKTNCQSTGWDGTNSNGPVTHENQPAGLFGSDGVEAFFLGGGSDPKTVSIHHDGFLRLGINADPTTPRGCTSPGYPEIEITTCEDVAGNSYPCS